MTIERPTLIRKIPLLIVLIISSSASAEVVKTIGNPWTGKPDYITAVTSNTLPSGSTQYIQNTSSLQSGATFYVSSGTVQGQLSAISIKFSDGTIQVSSPTSGGGGSGTPGGSNKQIQYNNNGSFDGYSFSSATTTGLILTAQAATDKPLIIQGASSQSGDLQEWKDSSANVLLAINPSGYLYQGASRLFTWNDPTLSLNSNLFLGNGSGNGTLTGYANSGIGRNTFAALSSGIFNLAIGDLTMPVNDTGSQNVAVGPQALYSNTDGSYNLAIGFSSMHANTHGFSNVAMGGSTLGANTTGSQNMAIGGGVMAANTTGSNNVGVGNGTLFANSSADYNVAIGANVLSGNTIGTQNTGVGTSSLGLTTTGSYNVGIGPNAGYSNTTGSYNTFIGYLSGYGGSGANLTNATAIGYNAQVNASNSLILGSAANIGIGTTLPATLLHMSSGTLTIDGTNAAIQIGPKTITSSYTLVASSSSTGLFSMDISTAGIVSYPANSAVTVTSCGTNPSVTGSNVGGTITVGSGISVTACTLTFSPAFKNTPLDCVESDDNSAIAGSVSSISNAAVTFSLAASLAGGHIYYHCDGND